MKFHSVFLFLLSSCLFYHCASPKRCNEGGKTKVYLTDGKRFKGLLKERNALCDESNALKIDTAAKGKQIRNTTQKLVEQQKNATALAEKLKECEDKNVQQQKAYQLLQTEYQGEKEKLNDMLTFKKGELQEKMRLLADKDEEIQHLKQRANQQDSAVKKLTKNLETEKNNYQTLLKTKEKSDKNLSEKDKQLQENAQKLAELQQLMGRQDSILRALNQGVKNALLGFDKDELSIEMKNGKVYVLMNDKLLFRSASAVVEPKGKEALKKLSEVLIKKSDIDIMIEGHTDNLPIHNATYKDNWDLSTARANSIVRLLSVDLKVPAKRLTAAGRGEFIPRAENTTPEGRAKNRRTEIILSPKLDELFKLIEKS